MDEDRLAGGVRHVVGKVRETAGDLTGDFSPQDEGRADQPSGKVQKAIGAAKHAIAAGVE